MADLHSQASIPKAGANGDEEIHAWTAWQYIAAAGGVPVFWAVAASIVRSPPANVSIWFTTPFVGGGFSFKVIQKDPPGPPHNPDDPDGIDPTADVEAFMKRNGIGYEKTRAKLTAEDIAIIQAMRKFK